MIIHHTEHPLAGTRITIPVPQGMELKEADGSPATQVEYRVEDYWDRISGGHQTWGQACGSNWAARNYAARMMKVGLPPDDEVVYGKIAGLGYILHVCELDDVL